ncbi:LysR family transcriptional regulator [Aliisedimentitalea scapharcae]|uniref:LysR family transcriptional regulator n=1 Tax=Aliisedimentitalea scapharcae TaxID=1524259 RepID=A0ABZ2XX39_9RHOB
MTLSGGCGIDAPYLRPQLDAIAAMNIKQLKTLLAVVEHKSFAAAGDRLGLSHSAVSLQIKAMEDELGVLLFDRIKRPPVPTARGRALAEHAQKTLALFDASASVARGELVRDKLTIGAVPTVLASFLPAGIKVLQAQYPALEITLRSGSSSGLAARLAEGDLDVAICTKPLNPIPGLDWHAIATEPFVVIAPAHAEGDDWRDLLQDHPFIWFNRKTWAGQSIEEELKAQKINVRGAMEIDSLEAISNLVSEGLGVAIVPICKGRRAFSNRIRHLPFGDPQFSREIGAFTITDGRSDLVIGSCIEALQSS